MFSDQLRSKKNSGIPSTPEILESDPALANYWDLNCVFKKDLEQHCGAGPILALVPATGYGYG